MFKIVYIFTRKAIIILIYINKYMKENLENLNKITKSLGEIGQELEKALKTADIGDYEKTLIYSYLETSNELIDMCVEFINQPEADTILEDTASVLELIIRFGELFSMISETLSSLN